jgi:hypothetical protein
MAFADEGDDALATMQPLFRLIEARRLAILAM